MPQADTASSTPDCPAERLGQEWAALYAESDRIEAEGRVLTPLHRVRIDQRIRTLADRREDIEAQVSWMTPQSSSGAMFQLMLLNTDIDLFYEEENPRTRARGRRLAYGILAFLAGSGADPGRVGGTILMPSAMDPHRAVELA